MSDRGQGFAESVMIRSTGEAEALRCLNLYHVYEEKK
jgi:hypothetical protein